MSSELSSFKKSVDDNLIARLCLQCKYRHTIYMFLDDIPICDFSSTTCARIFDKKKCPGFLRKQPIQLSLF